MGVPVYRTASTVPQYTDISVYRYTPTTDPQNLKWKTDNDLKTAIISTILGQLAFFSFLLVLNVIACLFRVLIMINFSTFLPFLPIFKKEKYTKNKKDFPTYRIYPVFGMLAETRLFLFYA